MILFVCPPKFCISIVFVLSWDRCKVQREAGNNAYAKFGGKKKEYYGIFRSGQLSRLAEDVVPRPGNLYIINI